MTKLKQIVKINPLFFAYIFPALADGTITSAGQNSQYWDNLKIVNEASPAYYFLLVSPWLFILGSIIWFIFWYWLFKKLKEPLNLFFMFLFIIGHSWGSSSWIIKIFKNVDIYALNNRQSIIFVWSLLILYFATIAGIATYCLKIYVWGKLQNKEN